MNAMTVSALSDAIKGSFQRDFSKLLVEGEISGFSASAAGHWYFSLKDQSNEAMIKCVMFRGSASRVTIRPQDGDQVLITGGLDFYKGRGDCQIICQSLQVSGDGVLLARLAKLKKELEKEGLFDQARKKPIPMYPKTIGVITSGTGAAVQDIIHTCGQLAPWVKILVYPTVVQGELCPPDVVRQIAHANTDGRADVLIVGRGGGSLEDLIGFSDERVVRAIAASQIPVLSAVGHATDDTMLSDFVADAHAITPTKAAEALCMHHARLKESAMRKIEELPICMHQKQQQALLKFRAVDPSSMEGTMLRRIQTFAQKADYLVRDMESYIKNKTQTARHRLMLLTETLAALNPQAVMSRGFSLIESPDGRLIQDPYSLKNGDALKIRWHKGSRDARIVGDSPNTQKEN